MKTPISEIADRYSILLLKSQRTDVDVQLELESYKNELISYSEITPFVSRLVEINGKIWDLESDIRKGKEQELGLEEVGRRALAIRDFNNVRVAIKNEITEFYGEGFKEIKKNHASE